MRRIITITTITTLTMFAAACGNAESDITDLIAAQCGVLLHPTDAASKKRFQEVAFKMDKNHHGDAEFAAKAAAKVQEAIKNGCK